MPEKKPLISVVMSVYNGDQFLAEAIESILHQSWRDFEFIIVDDASRDTTSQILEQYQKQDDRIHLLRNEVNSGLGCSLQKGVEAARGRFIARMDADDISLPDRFEKQLNYLINHSEIKILGSGLLLIDENGKVVTQMQFLSAGSLLKWNMLLGNGIIVSHPSVMMERGFIISLGGYC